MKIEVVKVGELECNCYLLSINDKVLVIDPGSQGDKIINKIGGIRMKNIIIYILVKTLIMMVFIKDQQEQINMPGYLIILYMLHLHHLH